MLIYQLNHINILFGTTGKLQIVCKETHVVTTAGRPSGIAATARATATYQKKTVHIFQKSKLGTIINNGWKQQYKVQGSTKLTNPSNLKYSFGYMK